MSHAQSVTLRGIGAGSAVAIAPLQAFVSAPQVPQNEPPSTPADLDLIRSAFASVAETLGQHAKRAQPPLSDVLVATAAMASDKQLIEDAVSRAHTGEGPAGAVSAAVDRIATMFEAAGGYLAERVTDLHSVRDRVIAVLLGLPEPGLHLTERSIIAALDLSPADTAVLDLNLVAGIVTERGGATGHTAIIARQLGIACVVACEGALSVAPGTLVAVDSNKGTVVVNPDSEATEAIERKSRTMRELEQDTQAGQTSCGKKVPLLANIGSPEDARLAVAAHAEGVGLFRTEVLFLDALTEPSREEQVAQYKATLEALGERKLVVRTLDAGADKPLAFANQESEANPALGVRGYRLTRTLDHLIDNQLAALATLDSPHLWTMAPMVATAVEAQDFAQRAHAAGLNTIGVMIETPSAALRAESILEYVDFVSIGTNDLAQYTMAADRLCAELSDLLSIWQPAVLDLVRLTAQAAKKANKPVGVCGESAGDPLMALVLVGLGVTSLSMSASAIAAVRFALKHHSLMECEAIADAVLKAKDAATAREAARNRANQDVVATLDV